jgi:hypothetical protein
MKLEEKHIPGDAQDPKFAADTLSRVIRSGERALICLPQNSFAGNLAREAVENLGGIAFFVGSDNRWKTLLRQVFSLRISTVIGTSDVLLGLAKLSRSALTPLRIRNAVIFGGVAKPWVMDGIRLRLDCTVTDLSQVLGDPLVDDDPVLCDLRRDLLAWTSILDCIVTRGECGLEIELVTFSGEKLPQLPSCARQVIRPWDPEVDEPLRNGFL